MFGVGHFCMFGVGHFCMFGVGHFCMFGIGHFFVHGRENECGNWTFTAIREVRVTFQKRNNQLVSSTYFINW